MLKVVDILPPVTKLSTDNNVVLRTGKGIYRADPKTRDGLWLKWDVSVLLGRVLVALVVQIVERGDQFAPGFAGADDLIDEAA